MSSLHFSVSHQQVLSAKTMMEVSEEAAAVKAPAVCQFDWKKVAVYPSEKRTECGDFHSEEVVFQPRATCYRPNAETMSFCILWALNCLVEFQEPRTDHEHHNMNKHLKNALIVFYTTFVLDRH